MRGWGLLAGTVGSLAVFTLFGSVAFGVQPPAPSSRDRHEPPKPVTVVNPATRPVPVAVQGSTTVQGAVGIVGTPTVQGAVSINGTPTVTVGNDVLRVEVTNPNPPAGGSAVLAPTAPSQLVDLVLNSACPPTACAGASHNRRT
jgi:hypothetical protein